MNHLILFALVALGISFVCSLLEAVILSVTPTYIAMAIKQGKRYGQILDQLKSQVDRPLAAILTFNTISHTVGAAGVGAEVHKLYGDSAVTIASGIFTFVVLVFSEIVPKTLGAVNWKKLAPVCAYLLRFMIYLVYPFVRLSEVLRRILTSGSDDDSGVTREEVIATAEIGASEGSIRPKESAVIKNLLMLDNIKVGEIMTPRSVMSSFEATLTVGQVIQMHKPIRFSRIPVYRGSLDHIEGMVHRYKILEAYSHDLDQAPITQFMTPIATIQENISVAAALDQFIKQHQHIFVVVDEYGTVSGLVSLEDAIETLLGVEIVDEFDSVTDMRQYALDLWRERRHKLLQQKLQTNK